MCLAGYSFSWWMIAAGGVSLVIIAHFVARWIERKTAKIPMKIKLPVILIITLVCFYFTLKINSNPPVHHTGC